MELTVLGQTLQQGYDFKFLGQITLINGVLSNTKSIFKMGGFFKKRKFLMCFLVYPVITWLVIFVN